MSEHTFHKPFQENRFPTGQISPASSRANILKDTPKKFGSFKARLGTRPTSGHSLSKIEAKDKQNIHFGIFDVETQRSAEEVGGWNRADLMGISCAVLYDSMEDRFFEFLDDQIPLLIKHLKKLDLVIGFNIKRFDLRVLSGDTDFDFQKLPTLDILEEVHHRLGYRLSLDHLAGITLNKKKSADGLQALRWWKQGQIREIIEYCRADVEITRDLFLYGKKNGYLLFSNKAKKTVRVPVKW